MKPMKSNRGRKPSIGNGGKPARFSRLTVKATDEELADWKQSAKTVRKTLSAWVRQRLNSPLPQS